MIEACCEKLTVYDLDSKGPYFSRFIGEKDVENCQKEVPRGTEHAALAILKDMMEHGRAEGEMKNLAPRNLTLLGWHAAGNRKASQIKLCRGF